MDIDHIKKLAEQIVAEVSAGDEKPDEVRDLVRMIKLLLPSVTDGPWYLSTPEDFGEGYEVQTMGPHPAPHYEETLAQFYPGNHGTGPAEMILLLMNNLELIVTGLERRITSQ